MLVSLICVALFAWIYLLRSAGGEMGVMGMGGGQMVQMAPALTVFRSHRRAGGPT